MSIKFESFRGTGGGAVTGGLVYKGSYNATTSSPSLVTAKKGDFYIVSVAGTLAGITLNVGDHIVFNQDAANPVTSAMFDVIDNTDAVASVNGQTGPVVLDTDDIAETATNQYFTNARFDTQLATKDTDDVAEGSSNLYYTNARFDTQLATKSTTNVAEGANLYYTNARFDTQLATKDTDNLTEGSSNLYFTSPRFTSELATKDTSNLTEGTNLYHTNARVDARIALANANDLNDVSYTAGAPIDGQVLTYVHANNRWEAAAASGGISSVNGDTGPTVVLDSDDVAEGSSNLYYTNARFDTQLATKSTTNVAEGANLYYTNARFDTQLATKDSDDVAEGSSNLYYTNARFDTQLATKDTSNLTEGTNLYYTNARFDTQLATKSTTNVAEGTNLYHTNARVDARIALANANDLNDVSYTAGAPIDGQVLTYVHANNQWEAAAASGGISSVNGDTGPTVVLDSDDVAEGSSNLYYTNARFDTQLATKSTTNVAEGTNLYYTNARFDTQLATKTGTSNGDILLLDAVGLPAVNGSQLTGLTTNIVEDSSPQLGGSLDVNGQDIVSVSNGAIELAPDGTGKVTIKGNATSGSGQIVLNCEQNTHGISLKGPPHSAAASYTLTFPNTDGNADQVLKSDGSGNLDWVDQASGGGGLTYQARTTASHSPLTPAADYHYSINADSATFVVNLPALSSLTDGQQIRFKLQARGNAAYDVTINRAGSDTIDGATSQTLSVTYSSITLVVGSTEWEIV